MPDHMHILVILGDRLTLGQCVARLKARTAATIRGAGVTSGWERDFFDRRIRPDEEILRVFLYIFLNPYREKLCPLDAKWPWFHCRAEDWEWFQHMLNADVAPPEWLM